MTLAAALSVLLTLLVWDRAAAPLPPSEGECTYVFKEVPPPKIMTLWYVVKHTDNLVPPAPDCMIVRFGRRDSFMSEFRMDIFVLQRDPDTWNELEIPVIFGDVTSDAGTFFHVSVPGVQTSFPPNIMVTRFDEGKGCLAVWTCQDMKGSTQKAAWIMCNSTDVDDSVVDQMEKELSDKADIDRPHFIPTKYWTCV